MGWNEWQAAIDELVERRVKRTKSDRQYETPRPKPKPKKKNLKKMTGMEYMMKLNREGRGYI